jgi:hypothetical protein
VEYEDFHIVADEAKSDRMARLLQDAGVRLQRRVITEIGHPEYVIAVHREDMDRAQWAFRQGLGPGPHRTFTSGGDR